MESRLKDFAEKHWSIFNYDIKSYFDLNKINKIVDDSFKLNKILFCIFYKIYSDYHNTHCTQEIFDKIVYVMYDELGFFGTGAKPREVFETY